MKCATCGCPIDAKRAAARALERKDGPVPDMVGLQEYGFRTGRLDVLLTGLAFNVLGFCDERCSKAAERATEVRP